jgi:hypothetical protein
MNRLALIICLSQLLALSTYAQIAPGSLGIFEEVGLFGQQSYGNTARISGIGGAVTALGGDGSSISTNPAGLGFFNRTVISITPSLRFYESDTRYFSDNTVIKRDPNFTVPNFSVVFDLMKDDIQRGKFRGGSFGFSVSRRNDFHQAFRLQTDMAAVQDQTGQGSSIQDFFVDQAGNQDFNSLGGLTGMAFDQYVISPFFDQAGNVTDYGFIQDGFPIQSEEVTTSGSINQFSFSLGGNYDDKLYFGVGLNIQTLNYSRSSIFIESDYSVDDPVLLDLTTTDFSELTGRAVSGTFGLIYRPIDLVRFGASITSPSSLNIDRESGFDMSTLYAEVNIIDPVDSTEVFLGEFFSESPVFLSEYKIRLPFRANFGTAIFFNKNGFISIDAEYIDYSSSRIQSNDFPVDADNETINNIYQSVWNYRIGAEYRFNIFRLRGGYAVSTNPNQLLNDLDADRTSFSFGLGVRLQSFFVDLTYLNEQWESSYVPYSFNDLDLFTPSATTQNTVQQYLLTLGFTF